jgi:hypothetical protein
MMNAWDGPAGMPPDDHRRLTAMSPTASRQQHTSPARGLVRIGSLALAVFAGSLHSPSCIRSLAALAPCTGHPYASFATGAPRNYTRVGVCSGAFGLGRVGASEERGRSKGPDAQTRNGQAIQMRSDAAPNAPEAGSPPMPRAAPQETGRPRTSVAPTPKGHLALNLRGASKAPTRVQVACTGSEPARASEYSEPARASGNVVGCPCRLPPSFWPGGPGRGCSAT